MTDKKVLSACKVQVRVKRMPRSERLSLNQQELERYRELANPANSQGKAILPTQDRQLLDQDVKSFSWQQTHYQRGMK